MFASYSTRAAKYLWKNWKNCFCIDGRVFIPYHTSFYDDANENQFCQHKMILMNVSHHSRDTQQKRQWQQLRRCVNLNDFALLWFEHTSFVHSNSNRSRSSIYISTFWEICLPLFFTIRVISDLFSVSYERLKEEVY